MLKLKQYFTIFLAYSLIYSQVFAPLVYAADIETDGTTQTTLDTSRNGVDIVNIAKPSSRGLSHNKFKKFNVKKRGTQEEGDALAFLQEEGDEKRGTPLLFCYLKKVNPLLSQKLIKQGRPPFPLVLSLLLKARLAQ